MVIHRALGDLRARPTSELALGGAEINLSQPIPVYRLGLDDLTGPDSLGKAVQVGWRYLLENVAGGGAGYADVKETPESNAKFSSLSQNRNAERLMEAAHLAQKVADEIPGDCEARILDVPAVYTSAVWLECPTRIFIPYISPKLAREGASVQVEGRFFEELMEAAETVRRHLPLPDGLSR